MNRLYLKKRTDSFALFSEGQRLFAGSTYEVRVDAPEFRADTVSAASVSLGSGETALASVSLAPDALRRGVRTGMLPIPARGETSRLELRVTLAGNTILLMDVTVVAAPTAQDTDVPVVGQWSVTDLGRHVAGAPVSLGNMAQATLVAAPNSGTLSITPSEGPFDAWLTITTDGGWGFPFSSVLVAGRSPVWGHQDSFRLASQKWILRLVKVAGDYYADLRAGRPGGVETDPDGAAVPGVEVNR